MAMEEEESAATTLPFWPWRPWHYWEIYEKLITNFTQLCIIIIVVLMIITITWQLFVFCQELSSSIMHRLAPSTGQSVTWWGCRDRQTVRQRDVLLLSPHQHMLLWPQGATARSDKGRITVCVFSLLAIKNNKEPLYPFYSVYTY